MRASQARRGAGLRACLLAGVGAGCLLWLSGLASAQTSRPAQSISPTDQQVDKAVKRGLEYLYRTQQGDGSWDVRYSKQHPGGPESLIVLAALSAGDDPNHPQLAAALKYINRLEPKTVYARAMRAMLYARLCGLGEQGHAGGEYFRRLSADTMWLAEQQLRSNGWGYGPGHPSTQLREDWLDACNTQMAMLALQEAADAGAAVPQAVWKRCRLFWAKAQNEDGGWGYQPSFAERTSLSSSYGTMTAGGAASVCAVMDRLAIVEEPPAGESPTRRPNPSPDREMLDRAIQWLADDYRIDRVPKWIGGSGDDWLCFYHFCLARLADAAGLRTIAGHDWYREMAAVLLASQRPDGSWGAPNAPMAAGDEDKASAVRTGFALLALCKGRAPVLINKLILDGAGDNDGRDAANVARWFSRELAWPVTWQVITPDAPKEAFAEAPVLYLAGRGKVRFPPELAQKVRHGVLHGATVLVQSFGNEPEFAAAASQFLAAAFPDFRSAALDKDHPVFSARYNIPAESRPQGVAMGDLGRSRIFILGSDLSGPWHQNRCKSAPQAFRFAANIVFYTTNRAMPSGKLAFRAAPPQPPRPRRTITLARIRHGGDWDANPLAIGRLNEALTGAISVGVEEAPAVDLSAKVPEGVELLWLTGSAGAELSAAQRETLKNYVLGGGTLFVDAAVGRKEFFEAATTTLKETFGPDSLKPLPADSPLLTGQFADGLGAEVNLAVAGAADAPESLRQPGPLWCVEVNGRVAVILSPLGVTCPMEGNPTWGCVGLSTRDARRLAANVALYAAMKQ